MAQDEEWKSWCICRVCAFRYQHPLLTQIPLLTRCWVGEPRDHGCCRGEPLVHPDYRRNMDTAKIRCQMQRNIHRLCAEIPL